MYLSDKTILELQKDNLIEPLVTSQLTSNGYDLKLTEYTTDLSSDFKQIVGTVFIKPNEVIKVKTFETMHMPNNIIGFLYLRSRYTRQGLLGMFAVVDAGYSGKLIATIKNLSDKTVSINTNEGVIHIVFAELSTKSNIPYGTTDHSHFQNQK